MPNTPNPPDVSGKRKVKFTPRMRNVLGVVGRKSEITGEPVSASEQKRLLAKKVKEKRESIAHREFNNDKYKNADHIMNCQKTGADLFHRKVQKKKVEKNFFPKDLLELMEQNPKFYFGSSS